MSCLKQEISLKKDIGKHKWDGDSLDLIDIMNVKKINILQWIQRTITQSQ